MSADRVPIALFARAPRAGEVKTRLVPALGAEGAAGLYRAFLEDTIAHVASSALLEPSVWIARAEDAPSFGAGLARTGLDLPVRAQPEGDLGERMRAALDEGAARAGRALVLGTDVPTLPMALVHLAARALEHADVVLGPSHDGGFYLLGVRAQGTPLGPGVRWSSAHALTDTCALARAAGRSVALLQPWYDVDTPDDLRLLRAHLTLRPSAAPRTALALGLASPGF